MMLQFNPPPGEGFFVSSHTVHHPFCQPFLAIDRAAMHRLRDFPGFIPGSFCDSIPDGSRPFPLLTGARQAASSSVGLPAPGDVDAVAHQRTRRVAGIGEEFWI
jgi:hypothetical protein